MSNIFDEVDFPFGLSFRTTGGPMFNVMVIESAMGFEQRWQRGGQAIHKYNVAYKTKTPAQLNAMLSFFMAREGSTRGFRFRDPDDYSSNPVDNISQPTMLDQVMAAIPGSTTTFQLAKNYSDGLTTFVRPITKPATGSVVIAVSGVLTSATVDYTTGIVSFGGVPAATPTAGFYFSTPARFSSQMENAFQAQSGQFGWGDMASIELEEIKVGGAASIGSESPIGVPGGNDPTTCGQTVPPASCLTLGPGCQTDTTGTGTLRIQQTIGFVAIGGAPASTMNMDITVPWPQINLGFGTSSPRWESTWASGIFYPPGWAALGLGYPGSQYNGNFLLICNDAGDGLLTYNAGADAPGAGTWVTGFTGPWTGSGITCVDGHPKGTIVVPPSATSYGDPSTTGPMTLTFE